MQRAWALAAVVALSGCNCTTAKTCKPTASCAAAGFDCGAIDDGCGLQLSCGSCGGSDTCGGGGMAHHCGHVQGPGGGTSAFLEDFLDAGNLDAAHTTAVLDTSGTGFLRAPAQLVMEDPGDGGEGALSLDAGPSTGPTLHVPLAPGTHQFSSVDLAGPVWLDADGGVTLLVAGPLHLSGNALLTAQGPLRVIVAGRAALDCSTIRATGPLAFHQTGDAGIFLDCLPAIASLETDDRDAGEGGSGALEIWTRGSLRLDDEGYLTTGRVHDVDAGSGDIVIRAYGDVRLGDTAATGPNAANSYIIAGRNWAYGPSGGIDIASEGTLYLAGNSYLIAGTGQGEQPGTNITTRTRGDTVLVNNSYYIAGSSGHIEVVAEGDLSLDLASYLLTGHDSVRRNSFAIKARSLTLGRASFIEGTNTALGGATDIAVEVSGGVIMDGGSGITGGPDVYSLSGCPTDGGGNVAVRAGGSVVLVDQFTEIAGGGGGTCQGGSVVVQAGGTIDADYADGGPRIHGGPGANAGTRAVLPGATLTLDAPDAGLRVESLGISKPLAGAGTVDACTASPLVPQGYALGEVSFSLDGGSTWTPAGSCAGLPLQQGFRYRAALVSRLFDGAALDKLELDWH